MLSLFLRKYDFECIVLYDVLTIVLQYQYSHRPACNNLRLPGAIPALPTRAERISSPPFPPPRFTPHSLPQSCSEAHLPVWAPRAPPISTEAQHPPSQSLCQYRPPSGCCQVPYGIFTAAISLAASIRLSLPRAGCQSSHETGETTSTNLHPML